ncbi:exonuclease 1 [Phoenix dactylifera]|uniref:Exonuclease 1 n=1 Tax=Phoenix dactylifera TaxID=42345 RepID=A0A8B7D2X0_PHODC|nr:exonuclease 1 [Phoenix dactylifera]
MGIQNLLRFLKPFIEPIHIKRYSGKRVGIDAYSWLHKGAYSCSMELCLNSRTDAAKRHLKYFMHRINLLRHYSVIPVVVFDGCSIPCKSATEHERHRRRESNLMLAKEKLKEGNVSAAVEFFKKAVRITPSMAHQLIQILRSESVEFIVSPYEADAQLAYLSALDDGQGGIAAVITEDSDLIAYGCKDIIFKMDRYGNGEEFLMDRVFTTVCGGLSFMNFDKELFTGMCVLAGCDFLPSIPGIGTKRAYSLVAKYKNLDRVLSSLKFDKRYQMPEDYSDSFWKTVAVFHHARIYDVETKALKPMKPLEQKHLQSLNGDLDLLGPDLPPSIAAAIAEGHLNPVTMEAFNYLSAAESCLASVNNAAACDGIDKNETQVESTQESCITIFSANQASEEYVTVLEEIAVDQKKYVKEALALGKLIAPSERHQVVEHEIDRGMVPDNNPFKKRKLEGGKSEGRESHMTEPVSVLTDERSVMLCSSHESQESVKSKPKKRVFVRKDKIQKSNTKDSKTQKSEKSGIFKFFRRL